ncbi:MAG: TIGR02466 family protein [Pseudomonadota bacterium]
MEVGKTIVSAFATPVSNYRWPDSEGLNAALADTILELKRGTPGLSKSNVGGWHSGMDFLDSKVDCVRELRTRLHGYVSALCRAVARDPSEAADFAMEGWANVLRHGQYNSLHCHPNAAWSGVYYVTGNAEPEDEHPFSGRLELVDPRPGASLSYSERTSLYGRFMVNPIAGQMVVFPGWLQHQVHPYFGPGERISIAFNVVHA